MNKILITTSDDLPTGVILTELRSNHLNRIERLSEVSIINNSNSDVTVTDFNGIVSNHMSTSIVDETLAHLDLPLFFKGVVIVTRRMMKPTDLVSSMRYYEKINNKVKLTTIAVDAHNALLNISNVNRLREYYIIYSIPTEELLIQKSIFIRGPNILVSVPGMELKSPLVEDKNPSNIFNSPSALTVSAIYYNNHPDTLYINILGDVVRLDSVESIDGEIGVAISISHDSYSDRTLILPNEYESKHIYKSFLEAKNKLNRNQYLDSRKLDLEYLKTESNIMLTSLNDAMTLFKNRMDLTSKISNMIVDREKIMSTKIKAPTEKVDTIKKVVDIVSMIKKVIF